MAANKYFKEMNNKINNSQFFQAESSERPKVRDLVGNLEQMDNSSNVGYKTEDELNMCMDPVLRTLI